jgi:hypothetical protein
MIRACGCGKSAVSGAAQHEVMCCRPGIVPEQEVVTFAVFAGFYLREPITLSQGFGFALNRRRRLLRVSLVLKPVSTVALRGSALSRRAPQG